MKNGREAVYRKGRLVGYVSKPTKKQSKVIEAKNKRRVKDRERKARKEALKYADPTSDVAVKDNGWLSGADVFEAYATYPKGQRPAEITLEQQSTINYSKQLKELVEAGIISVEEANERYEDFINGTDSDKNRAWSDIHELYTEYDFFYSDLTDVVGAREID